MNHLSRDKQVQIINLLVEGCSIRSVSRLTGAHVKTILDLLVRVGDGCARLHDRMAINLRINQLQLDEIWTFVHTKQGHLPVGASDEHGDAYTFVGIDRDSKYVASYLVGKRTWRCTTEFCFDLRKRIVGRPQISSDAFSAYTDALERAFGADMDYGQVVKTYAGSTDIVPVMRRYSPPRVTHEERIRVRGNPDEDFISTSHVERNNLTTRTFMKRFQRLTLSFSKKLANLEAAVALHFAFYNLVWTPATLAGLSPAMAVGVADRLWTVAELVDAALSATVEDARSAA